MFGEKKSPRSGGAVETLVGTHAVIRGDVKFNGGLYVEGEIHGKVLAEDGAKAVLTIADNGLVEGEVRAPVVCINGRMVGDVHAAERVELAANARVQGNIHYKVIEMAAGAMITGRLIHADAPLAQLTGPDAATASSEAKGAADHGKIRAVAQQA
jgi:cytoskeletal protein CcmA (bactofilin family)